MENTEFDLTRAMAGEKVVTRLGIQAIYIRNDGSRDFQYVFQIGEDEHCFDEYGSCWPNLNDDLDLFMASEPKQNSAHSYTEGCFVASEVEEKKTKKRVICTNDFCEGECILCPNMKVIEVPIESTPVGDSQENVQSVLESDIKKLHRKSEEIITLLEKIPTDKATSDLFEKAIWDLMSASKVMKSLIEKSINI